MHVLSDYVSVLFVSDSVYYRLPPSRCETYQSNHEVGTRLQPRLPTGEGCASGLGSGAEPQVQPGSGAEPQAQPGSGAGCVCLGQSPEEKFTLSGAFGPSFYSN